MPVMDSVQFDCDARGVATITLCRPEQLNAINLEMRDLLWTYLEACRDNPDVRLILFRGEGRTFSAGADISEFGTAPSIMEARRARHDRDVWGMLLGHRCITVAAMHGYCYGAGLELPLCCDYRIAAEGTRFALPEVTLGYIPSAGGTQTLPRIAPPGIAARMILTGEPISTGDALRWGLVNEVAPGDSLGRAVEAAVARLLEGDPSRATFARRAMLEDLVVAGTPAW
jgi:enoyl-CoA hydratase/carnithine racemase